MNQKRMPAQQAVNCARPIRLLLVDDHHVVRAGLAAVFRFHKELEVVAEAGTGAEAVALFPQCKPDVTLMDLRMPDMDGFETMLRLRSVDPTARVLVLTTSDSQSDIQRARKAGASGYLLKTAAPREVLAAILSVHSGGEWFADHPRAPVEPSPALSLTPRQREVLELLAKGFSNKEIAAALQFTEDGAKAHMKAIFTKLGVKDRTQAIIAALNRKLVRV